MKSNNKKITLKSAQNKKTKSGSLAAKTSTKASGKAVRKITLKAAVKKQDETPKEFLPFGGSLLKNSNAKTPRPVSTKHPMHVVLRSSAAKGKWSLKKPTNAKIVEETFKHLASEYSIKVHESLVANDQVHLLIQLGDADTFAPFIRSLSGTIAIKVTGANKLAGLKEKFWDFRPWTRVVSQKRGYSLLKDYAG